MRDDKPGADVLIVDDDPVGRLLTAQTLQQEGYRIREAENGRIAMASVRDKLPDLILLDVMMPEVDGFAFCGWLRAQPPFQRVPVLMMTGLEDADSIRRAFECGASDFIAKPINWPVLAQRARFLLRASQALEALAASQASLAEAQRIAHLGSWSLDHASGALTWSEEVFRIFEQDPADFAGSLEGLLASVHPEDRERLQRAFWGSVWKRREYDLVHRLLLPGGAIKWVHERGLTEYTPAGDPLRSMGTVQDITERRESEATIRFLSLYDSLTGLPNRSLFDEQAQRAIPLAQRRGTQLAILHLGLDRFLRVNESLGHTAGDSLLCQTAERLLNGLRACDCVARDRPPGAEVELARWGGDEFAVLLQDLHNPDDAARVAARLVTELAQPYRIGGHEVTLGASIGIALYPGDGACAADLTANASTAMRHAKRHEPGSYHFYAPAMNAHARVRLALESDLRRALERGEGLRLHYQPQVDRTGGLRGVEALVRWRHPELGLLEPDRFIPLAEDTGLIIPLGDWVLREACAQMRAWRDLAYPPLRVAINLSPAQFRHKSLVEDILAALAAARLSGSDLEVELTERQVMEDAAGGRGVLEALHDAGVHLAVDDFGTGYSSLSYLSFLPLDVLKIDRAFVRDTLTVPGQAAIVRAIIALAGSLSLSVVAEGVETEAQAAVLWREGCDAMQGYLYDRPLPADVLERRWLRAATPPAALVLRTLRATAG
jgi:diguanylate cyclase (GGDEF)-like protein